MSLDIDAPPAPRIVSNTDVESYEDVEVFGSQDYRREELQEFLDEGAWERSFNEWAEHTDVSSKQFGIVEDLDLIADFDFFWDDFANRVGYHAPGLPENWKERKLHPNLTSWGDVSAINAGLTELGQIVSDVLKDEYVDWEAEYEAPEDLPDFS
ncbi:MULTISPECIES: hypothetical protein [unclassified Haladaptatus]|uniref:hypothetical protein n=1 Tax=unclassified Haladaptatus TaxID=2622732 RepID=UPI0023E8DF8E|nr:MULTISPECIES: hypothetical protein [unclassified Haladaptatus]